ncbi:hypothetical protein QTN25_009506 [Entamoeba marina]
MSKYHFNCTFDQINDLTEELNEQYNYLALVTDKIYVNPTYIQTYKLQSNKLNCILEMNGMLFGLKEFFTKKAHEKKRVVLDGVTNLYSYSIEGKRIHTKLLQKEFASLIDTRRCKRVVLIKSVK